MVKTILIKVTGLIIVIMVMVFGIGYVFNHVDPWLGVVLMVAGISFGIYLVYSLVTLLIKQYKNKQK